MNHLARLLPGVALVLALAWTSGGASAQGQTGTKPPPPATTPAQAQVNQGAPRGGQPPDGRGGQTPRPDYKFWKDDAVKKELALTEVQVARIDRIYDLRAKEIDSVVQEWFKQRDKLDEMTRAREADVPTYKLQASHVDALSAEIHASRTVMLYRMSLVLTPEQNKKLQEINDRNGRGRRGGGPHSN